MTVHRIRLPAPWVLAVVPGIEGLCGERSFQSPTGLDPATEVAIEIRLAHEFADNAKRLSISVNDHCLDVRNLAPGLCEAIVPQAFLLARNQLLVSVQGTTDESIFATSWIGLRLR